MWRVDGEWLIVEVLMFEEFFEEFFVIEFDGVLVCVVMNVLV